MVKFFFPLLPPLFTQAMAAKNITSPIAIFDPCTHGKKFFTPSMKKVVPMCGGEWFFDRQGGISPPVPPPTPTYASSASQRAPPPAGGDGLPVPRLTRRGGGGKGKKSNLISFVYLKIK